MTIKKMINVFTVPTELNIKELEAGKNEKREILKNEQIMSKPTKSELVSKEQNNLSICSVFNMI